MSNEKMHLLDKLEGKPVLSLCSDWYGRAQSIVGCANPGHVVYKKAGCKHHEEQASDSTPPWPLLQSLLGVVTPLDGGL